MGNLRSDRCDLGMKMGINWVIPYNIRVVNSV